MAHHGETVGVQRLRWRWLLIPLCGVLGLAAGIVWAVSLTPIYTANAFAYVTLAPPTGEAHDNDDPFSGGKFALQRAPTYAALATSTEVLRAVAADVHRGNIDQLRSQIQAAAVPGKVILQFSVEDADPQAAAQIANSVVVSLGRSVSSLELGGAGFLAFDGRQQSAPVQIVPIQPALVAPLTPRWYKPVGGLLAGLLVGAGLCYSTRTRAGTDPDAATRGIANDSLKPTAGV